MKPAIPWLAIALALVAFWVLWPFLPWILLAVWTSVFARPLHARLARRLGGRPRIAGAITVILIVALFVPIAIVVTSLTIDAIALISRVIDSEEVRSLVNANGDGTQRSTTDLVQLALAQSGRAWTFAQEVAGTAARVIIGLVIFIAGVYAMLVDGRRWYAWIEEHAPVPAPAMRRLAGAFIETGRGLFFGILGAGFAQAAVATVLYVALGVPQALALGLITLACSVVPAIGTAIVWAPVSIGLYVTGRETEAFILAGAGVLVIGTIDNLVRPWLARRGKLELPTYVVLVAIFGGVELFGGRGILLGPLFVRLAKEALAIWRDARHAEAERC